MNKKKFKEELGILGMYYEERDVYDNDCVYSRLTGDKIAEISKSTEGVINTSFRGFSRLTPKLREVLLNLMFKYSLTTIQDRKNEKKYKVIIRTTERDIILWQATDGSGDTDFINFERVTTGKKVFTEKEIREIDDRFMAFVVEVN